MATHSSVFSWRIPRTKERGRLRTELDMTEATYHAHIEVKRTTIKEEPERKRIQK